MATPSFPQVSCWQVWEEPGWALPWPAWPLTQKAGLLMEGGCREVKGGAGRTVGCRNPLRAAALEGCKRTESGPYCLEGSTLLGDKKPSWV